MSHEYPYDANREEDSADAPASEPEPVEAPECPQCHGETYHLGDLGRRAHFRCRACGWNTSVRIV
jgi:hypothetical protein